MVTLMQTSLQGIKLIKEFEGFSPISYNCPAGKKTIGYGHSIESMPFLTSVSEVEAEIILRKELDRIDVYLKSVIKQDIVLTQGMFDALSSLIFNWGFGNFGKSIGLKALNNKRYSTVDIEFFSKSKGVVNINGKFSNGLYRRRQAELRLWNDKT